MLYNIIDVTKIRLYEHFKFFWCILYGLLEFYLTKNFRCVFHSSGLHIQNCVVILRIQRSIWIDIQLQPFANVRLLNKGLKSWLKIPSIMLRSLSGNKLARGEGCISSPSLLSSPTCHSHHPSLSFRIPSPSLPLLS